MNSIKLSVCMIAYNQAAFIVQAIEGVLMQKCNFDYELVIGEDCSTDKTRQICQGYASKYSEISLLPSETNLGMIPNFIRTMHACTGKYIALCEGDDYWTDPYKLQKQVDFLEANEDFVICHHNLQVIYENNTREPHLSNNLEQKEVTTIQDLAYGNYIFTASCIFRNGLIKELPDWFCKAPVGDYILHMLNAQYGKIKYLPDVMGVYRVHDGGAWSNRDTEFISSHWMKLIEFLIIFFNDEIVKNNLRIQYGSTAYSLYSYLTQNQNFEKAKMNYIKACKNNPELVFEKHKGEINQLKTEISSVRKSKAFIIGKIIIKPFSIVKKFLNIAYFNKKNSNEF